MDAVQTNEQSQPVSELVNEEKLFASLTYIPFLNLVTCPLAFVRYPKSLFSRFHIRQGFMLLIFWFLSLFALVILPAISALFGGLVSAVLWIFLAYLSVIGAIHARKGEQFILPFVGDIASHLHIDDFFQNILVVPEAKSETPVVMASTPESVVIDTPVSPAEPVVTAAIPEPVIAIENPVEEPAVVETVEAPVVEEKPVVAEEISPVVAPETPVEAEVVPPSSPAPENSSEQTSV